MMKRIFLFLALTGLSRYAMIKVDYLHIAEKKELVRKLFASRAKQLPEIAVAHDYPDACYRSSALSLEDMAIDYRGCQ